jgi:hypothetical protein
MTQYFELPDVDFIFSGRSLLFGRPSDNLTDYSFVYDVPFFLMAKNMEN